MEECEKSALEKLFDAKLAVIEARLAGMDEANKIYREDMKGNLEHLNKVRAEVIQDRGTFVTKTSFDDTIKDIHRSARSAWFSIIGWFLAVVAPIIASFVTWAVFRK